MDIPPITYRARTVAACTRERFFLSDELDSRPAGNPELTLSCSCAPTPATSPAASCPAPTATTMRAATRAAP
jgi:hypothetical protein